MMCIIYAGQDMTQDTAVRLECLLLFSNCVKLSAVLIYAFVFQVQCQLHPSAPRSKLFFFLVPFLAIVSSPSLVGLRALTLSKALI